MSADGRIRIAKRGQGNDACSPARRVREELFAELDRGAAGVNLACFGVTVRSGLVDGPYEPGGSRAEKWFEEAWVLLSSSASAAVILTEKVDDGGTPYVQSVQSKSGSLN